MDHTELDLAISNYQIGGSGCVVDIGGLIEQREEFFRVNQRLVHRSIR